MPEYLKLRFDERTRCLNSITFAVMTVFASGISMNALAKLLHQLLGWDYDISLWICSAVVLVYVLKGGLTSAIYTEVLQFFMIVLGFAPVVYLGMKDVGGWAPLTDVAGQRGREPGVAGPDARPPSTDVSPDAWTSAWQPLLGGTVAQPDGRRLVRHGLRPGLRAFVRLLVYELPGGAAGDGRQEHDAPRAARR